MTACKTAAMFATPFAMGALLGGASGETVSAFRQFGYHVGLAFQAMDDILGIWGETAITGKPVGDDLRSRKVTYPVLVAAEAPGEVRASFVKAYQDRSHKDVARLTRLVEEAGGRSATEQFILDEVRLAMDAVGGAGLNEEGCALCAEYAGLASGRVK
jgi:geranylgeranyl diphosphate synthase type I